MIRTVNLQYLAHAGVWTNLDQPTFDPQDGGIWWHDIVEHAPFDDGRLEGESFAFGVSAWLNDDGKAFGDYDRWFVDDILRRAHARGYPARGPFGTNDQAPMTVQQLARVAGNIEPSCERALCEGWAFANRYYNRDALDQARTRLVRLQRATERFEIANRTILQVRIDMQTGEVTGHDVTTSLPSHIRHFQARERVRRMRRAYDIHDEDSYA